MRRVVSNSPLISIMIFIAFCMFFETLTSTYQVDSYQQAETRVLQRDTVENRITVKVEALPVEAGMKVKLIYSDKQPAFRGIIEKTAGKSAEVYFEKLSKVSDDDLERAVFEYGIGMKPIGEGLSLWK